MNSEDIAFFKEIFDKKYNVHTDLYIDRKYIKSISQNETDIVINGRYSYCFNNTEKANTYFEYLIVKLGWK